jgi:response regulator NasT
MNTGKSLVMHANQTSQAPQSLRIVVVAPELVISDPMDDYAITQAERSRSLRIGLLENGFNLVAVLPADTFLNERLTQLQPDMIIVDAESQARDALEHVVVATRDARRPIVMFTNDNDTSHVKDAVAAGVSAYIVAGLSSERIRPILDVAMARFQHEQALRQELADTKVELQDRKIIDRAKGMLMQRQGLNEQAAYDRKTCSHSREGGNPQAPPWIPAFAGMTRFELMNRI